MTTRSQFALFFTVVFALMAANAVAEFFARSGTAFLLLTLTFVLAGVAAGLRFVFTEVDSHR